MQERRKKLGFLLKSVGTLLILFAGLEAAAQLWLLLIADDAQFTRYASWRQLQRRPPQAAIASTLEPHRYLGYLPAAGAVAAPNRHSLRGFRGAEPRSDRQRRIVCSGGSGIYSVGVADWRESFPAQLEEALSQEGEPSVEVVNAGVPGWTSWEVLIDFSLRLLDLDPDTLILGFDLEEIDARLIWPSGAYRADNSGRRAASTPSIWMPPVWEYSTFLRGFAIKLNKIPPHGSRRRALDVPKATSHAEAFLRERIEGSYPQGVFEYAAADRMLHVNDPRHFERNLSQLLTLARQNEIEVVLLALAVTPLEQDPRTVSAEYRTAIAEHNQILERLAEQFDATFVSMDEVEEEQLLGITWSAAGNRWRAERVASRLREGGGSRP